MPESNQSGNYDHVRCPVCARPWLDEHDDLSLICNRHRPAAVPAWVEVALSNHERARAVTPDLPPPILDLEKALARHERARDAAAVRADGGPKYIGHFEPVPPGGETHA